MKNKLNRKQLFIIAIIGILLWLGAFALELCIELEVVKMSFLESNRYILRIILTVGIWLFAGGYVYYIVENQKLKNPEEAKQIEIEAQDERILMIRRKAKAKVSDMLTWGFIIVGYLVLIITGDWIISCIFFGVSMLKTFIELYFVSKYGKTM